LGLFPAKRSKGLSLIAFEFVLRPVAIGIIPRVDEKHSYPS
jgi:hypothetical protein